MVLLHGLEVRPHGGRWIGEPAQREGISRKQKTEIVLNKRERNGAKRKNGEAQEKCSGANKDSRQCFPSRDAAEALLN
jgi:hypothetical protein